MSPQIVQPQLFTNSRDTPFGSSTSPAGRFSAIFRDFPNTKPLQGWPNGLDFWYNASAMVRVEHTDGDERDLMPERFVLAGRDLEVEAVIDRWFGPVYTYFTVRASDGRTYRLKHDRSEDSWELLFTETDAPEPPAPTWPFTRPQGSRPG